MSQILLFMLAFLGCFLQSLCLAPVMKIDSLTLNFTEQIFDQFTECLSEKKTQCSVKYLFTKGDRTRGYVNATQSSRSVYPSSSDLFYRCVDSSTDGKVTCSLTRSDQCNVLTSACTSPDIAILWGSGTDYLISEHIRNCSSYCTDLKNLVLYERVNLTLDNSMKGSIDPSTRIIESDHIHHKYAKRDVTENPPATTTASSGSSSILTISLASVAGGGGTVTVGTIIGICVRKRYKKKPGAGNADPETAENTENTEGAESTENAENTDTTVTINCSALGECLNRILEMFQGSEEQ